MEDIAWKVHYGTPSKTELSILASAVSSYAALIHMPERLRRVRVRQLRDALKLAASQIPTTSGAQVKLSKDLRKNLKTRDRFERSKARAAVTERGKRLKAGHTHPGYLIGIHWLSVAYERICAGEPESSVMYDFGYRQLTYKTKTRS